MLSHDYYYCDHDVAVVVVIEYDTRSHIDATIWVVPLTIQATQQPSYLRCVDLILDSSIVSVFMYVCVSVAALHKQLLWSLKSLLLRSTE